MVYLENAPKKGVGPHDVAIALVAATFKSGCVKNKVLEFVGPGVKNLSVDYRNGIDVMTTETTCLTSIWETDEKVHSYLKEHGREADYKELKPGECAYYDGMIKIDLAEVEPMIALPFHPSNAYTIREFLANSKEILEGVEKEAREKFGAKINIDLVGKIDENGVMADQGIIAGCSGGLFNSIAEAAAILDGGSTGNGYFGLSIYPTSVPVSLELTRIGATEKLLAAGAVIKPSFCGPCFGAGDVPSNNGLSIRHATRNFPNREGSKPGEGQISCVALMDARSIAATALNGGYITPATEIDYEFTEPEYHFDGAVYEKRLYNGYGRPDPTAELKFGPNITDWPKMYALTDNILLKLAAVIKDPVTTTDELIPSGETSSYRSNPIRLSEFALSRRVPEYVGRSKAINKLDLDRREGIVADEVRTALDKVGASAENTGIASVIFANKPGDGSAREQAASCQKVLGGGANICYEYATKRYRSNCINWGIIPFTLMPDTEFAYDVDDYVFIPGIRDAIANGIEEIPAKVIAKDGVHDITLCCKGLTAEEKEILVEGCLMNYYASKLNK